MQQNDLLIIIAVWQFITAALAFAGVVLIGVIAIPGILAGTGMCLWPPLLGLGLALAFLLAYCGLAVAAGIGIMYVRPWGRALGIVHAALSLLRIPLGTAIGLLVIIYLARSDVKASFEGAGEG